MPQRPPTANPQRYPQHWKFLDIKEILETEAKQPPWRIKGLVAEGCGTLVSALPHGMKSFTWLQANMDAALGRKIWNHFEAENIKRTLFIETEDAEWILRQRVKFLATGMDVSANDVRDAGAFMVGCLGPFDLVQMSKQLKSAIAHYKPDLTVLSTLQGLLGERDWNEQSEMGPVNALLVDIAQNYSPLVAVTHSPLDPKKRRAAGTVTQGANYPFHCHYRKEVRNGETFANVLVDSKLGTDEEGNQFKLKLMAGPDSIRFVYQDGAHVDAAKAAIIEHLVQHPEDKASDIAILFDVSKRYVNSLRAEIEGRDA